MDQAELIARIEKAARERATDLYLRDRGITEVPEQIGQLANLQWLYLHGNQLSTLPEQIGQLTNLQTLALEGNQLATLPEQIGQLTNLQTLTLEGNQLTTLPEQIGQLTNLQTLTLEGNQLTTLPEQIGQLTNLQTLYLEGNQLTTLPEQIGQLAELQELYLQDNQLTTLPEKIGQLADLRDLHLDGNPLAELPGEMRKLRRLGHLDVSNCPGLNLPPEIVAKRNSPEEILEYYFRVQRGRRPLNEAKLILVGRGGVGKTCLIKRLVHNTFDEHEPETPGIEIQSWPVTVPDGNTVRLHVWDFGGQEILHATHQFFLTERTLYLLVLSGREDSPTQDAEYWLQLIRSFGGDSRIIIALNKSAQHPFDVNRGLLLEKYPAIADFVQTDCADGTGIGALRQMILHETDTMEHRKVGFPAEWFAIKERLAAMPESFVTWDEYQGICRDLGETDAKAQRTLAGFMHTLGIALNYRDDPRLREHHVLNPNWVTEGIYTLLRAGQKERGVRKGVLAKADLASVLDAERYPDSCHDFLLRLMEKFQLCFRVPGTGEHYLVPELLGENQPEGIKGLLAQPGLGFRYQHEVLPNGLLPRFIVQTHTHSEAEPAWRWRTGVVLHRDGCAAIVRADARERRVDIHVVGPERQRRDLLAIIREKFAEQHRDLNGLTVNERVPIPGEPGVTVGYAHLLVLDEEGERWCRPEGARRKHRVADLLNGVESEESRQGKRAQEKYSPKERSMPRAHVFLSYCHDNESDVARLHDELVATGETVWWDKDILGGQDWKLEIRQAMKDAYAVVLCLSQESQARTTAGIYPEALDAIATYREYAPGSIFLIPVRLSDCEIPLIEIDGTRTLDRLQYVDLFPTSQWPQGVAALVQALRATPNHP